MGRIWLEKRFYLLLSMLRKGGDFLLQNLRRLFSDRATLLTICALAWPTIVEQALQTAVQYIDTAMVGRIGANASAAVGLTTTMMWLVNGPFFAMGIGVLACISKAFGAKEIHKAKTAAMQAIFLALGLGTVLGAATLCISPFLPKWLGAEPEIEQDAFLYFFITCLPMIFRASSIMMGSVLRAARDTKTPMLVNIATNLCNVVLNFLLINQSRTLIIGSFSFPMWGAGLGVAGAAVATAIAHTLGGTLMMIAVWRNPMLSPRGEKLRVDKPILSECVRVGLPVAGERAIACLGQVAFTALVSRLGTLALATHSLAITAEQAFYIPGYGMQAAAATLAGNAVGERDERKLTRTATTIMILAACIMGVLATFLFCFPDWMMGLFTKDAQVIAGGIPILRIVAVSEPLFGILIILEGTFNGVGDTKAPFVFSAITMWGVRILGTLICTRIFSLGLNAVWICMVADNISRCVLLMLRFISGRWKQRLDFTAKLTEVCDG